MNSFKVGHYMSQSTSKMMYYGLLHPHLFTIWGIYNSFLRNQPVFKIKSLKLSEAGLLETQQHISTHNFRRSLNCKNYEVGKGFFWKWTCTNRIYPMHFSFNVAYLEERSELKKLNLLYIPHYKKSRLQRSIKYLWVKIWNEIPHPQNYKLKF